MIQAAQNCRLGRVVYPRSSTKQFKLSWNARCRCWIPCN